MFRKSALAMAMLGALSATNAVALGLGEIELKSALNQPLNAEVELLSATESELAELKVTVASPQAFANAGIDRPLFLSKLKFDVTRRNGKSVVHISSRDVVREPFLDFLLELSWSKGRLMREYTVLVDPPVTMPAPAPVLETAQASAPSTPATSASRRSHTAILPPLSTSPMEYGPTKRNDTLWNIAQQVRPDEGVSVEQTMLGLLRANPEAFIDNNINNLKAGYVLRIPGREELTSISRGDALRQSRAQYDAWRVARAATADASAAAAETIATDAAASGDAAAGSAGGAVAVQESSLQLVAPEQAEAGAGGEGEQTLDALQRDLMMANEALEAERRQGEEMTSRLSVLEEQIANMQRLIQLKDDELARLQATAGQEPESLVPMDQPAETESVPAEMAPEAVVAEAGETAEAGMAESPVEGTAETVVGEVVEAGTEAVEPEMTEAAMPTAEISDTELPAEIAEAMAAVDAETDAAATGEAPVGVPVPESQAEVEPEVAAEPVSMAVPETATTPGFVDRLLEHPLWLGAGAAVLALLSFFGLRRRRSVETEFQESILQAARSKADESDSEMVATQPESTDSKANESSLLSEFAVSDMGSLKNDGEADPLAEADVYLAYGRFQQAEDLIKDALGKDPEREELNLKLLEVFLAARNQSAFDEHAQGILARLENSDDPLWEKVAEMGRELSPENPMYQAGGTTAADEAEDLSAGLDFDMGTEEVEPQAEEEAKADEGLDFDIDLSFDAGEIADENKPDSVEFTPPAAETRLEAEMDSIEPDVVPEDNALDFDLESFDMEAADEDVEEAQGDGELADLDEISTKLDLARAYIDMGDPDGAKSILDEVIEEGNDNQKGEARDIMAQMS